MSAAKILNPVSYLPLIYACLSFPMMALTRDYSTGEQIGILDLRYALVFYLLMIFISLRKVFLGKISPLPLQAGDQFFLLFASIAFVQALIEQSLPIFTNIVLLLGIAFSLRCASKHEGFIEGFLLSSIILLAFLLTARIVFGSPDNRWLGGIHPNNLSGPALVATILAMFAGRRVLDIVAAISFGMAVIVSSRYAMVSIVFTYACFWLVNFRLAGFGRISVIALGIFSLMFFELQYSDGGLISELLALNDDSRGIGSGASGRDGHWAQFMPQFLDKPFLGFGFRNREAYYGAHNGFLNLILENGLLGGGAFLLFFAFRVRQAAKIMKLTPKSALRGQWLVAYLTVAIGAMLQPQLINFGDAFGLTVLLLLFSRMKVDVTKQSGSREQRGRKHQIQEKTTRAPV